MFLIFKKCRCLSSTITLYTFRSFCNTLQMRKLILQSLSEIWRNVLTIHLGWKKDILLQYMSSTIFLMERKIEFKNNLEIRINVGHERILNYFKTNKELNQKMWNWKSNVFDFKKASQIPNFFNDFETDSRWIQYFKVLKDF